jgi:hypothetical protein
VRLALKDLARLECQIIRADGQDLDDNTWGDQAELLYLTDIGRGYRNCLIYDADFVQEVMMDCRVDPMRYTDISRRRPLTEKLRLLHRFLQDVFESDAREVEDAIKRLGTDRYRAVFDKGLVDAKLASLDIISRIYLSVVNIHRSVEDEGVKSDLKDVLDYFRSLKTTAWNKSCELLHVEPSDVPDEDLG